MKLKFLTITFLLTVGYVSHLHAQLDRRYYIVYSDDPQTPYIQPRVGKYIRDRLLKANGDKISTTSCRLENKVVVSNNDLNEAINEVARKGYRLKDRESKNLEKGALSGTFTIYGTAIKFIEARYLPKTSIKMRVRVYTITTNDGVYRADITKDRAYLELKIKNPFPEYPLSVHKYRIMLLDKDIITLLTTDPTNQGRYKKVIKHLKHRARAVPENKDDFELIDEMLDQIKNLGILYPQFIKPMIAISYNRISKKYNEEYKEKKKKKHFFKKAKYKEKKRNYQLTIDKNLKAFMPEFSHADKSLNIAKYFVNNGINEHLIAAYPSHLRVVEFKQPDAIGYEGPGRIKEPDSMKAAQKALWQAFVGDLLEKAVPNSTPNKGKFSHVKQFLRIKNGYPKYDDKTMLLSLKEVQSYAP